MTSRSIISEQPIFTCQAHVFHIDPKTKRTWITASTKAISVSFFYDSSRNLYRIISVEGTKVSGDSIDRSDVGVNCDWFQAVINSTITPNMTFTQTSQKFGQWSDVRANTVYGELTIDLIQRLTFKYSWIYFRSRFRQRSGVGQIYRKVSRGQGGDQERDGQGEHKRKLCSHPRNVGKRIAGDIAVIDNAKRQLCVGHCWPAAISDWIGGEWSRWNNLRRTFLMSFCPRSPRVLSTHPSQTTTTIR